MNYTLIPFDTVVIVVYLLLSLVIGIAGSKFLGLSGKKEEDYFLAGRRMPGWLNGVSVAATALNSDVAPLYCGVALVAGLSSGWFFLSRFGLGMLAAALLFAIRWRQLRIRTGPEFFQLRFGGGGRKFARVYSSLFSVLAGMIPWIGAGLIGMHMVMAPIFGIESRLTTILIVMPILTVYVWTSGLAGVLITDAMQSFIILLANVIMAAAVLVAFGGPTGLSEAIFSAAGPAAGERILSSFPAMDTPVVNPLGIFAWMLITTVGVGGGVGSDGQRLFSCRDAKQAAKVGIWAEVTLFAMLLLMMLPTLGLLARHPEMYNSAPGERERAYGMMILEFIPPGLIGLTVAALLSSVMSTVSTHLNYGSQTLLNDVYRPLFGEPKAHREVWIGRFLMLFIVGLSIVVALTSGSLLGIALKVIGIFGASASFGWGQWWHWRVNFKAWCASVLAGPVVYFVCGFLLPNIPWWARQLAISETHAQNMAILQAAVALVINTGIWIAVTCCTKPEDMAILKEFYLRARPMGCWGPVRAALIAEGRLPDEPVRPLIVRGLCYAAVGLLMVVSGVFALSNFYIGRYDAGTAFAIAALAAALVFKRLFNDYLKRNLDHLNLR